MVVLQVVLVVRHATNTGTVSAHSVVQVVVCHAPASVALPALAPGRVRVRHAHRAEAVKAPVVGLSVGGGEKPLHARVAVGPRRAAAPDVQHLCIKKK